MRSGCSLPATVLLLLFSGLAVWAARHWTPNFICDGSGHSWFCGDYADVAGTLPGAGSGRTAPTEAVRDDDTGGSKTVASALPWPVAEKSRTWSNFRDGAYDIAAVAPQPNKPAASDSGKTQAHGFPWPVADAPRKWSNFRDGAFSVAAAKTEPATTSKTVAHPFPWPIADAPRKWNNVRKAPKRKKIVATKKQSKTEPHPFPWPVADAPRTWTNFRKAPAPSQATGIAHAFPWPVADVPVKWSNFREGAYSSPAQAEPEATSKTVPHAFPWPVADAPRKWTNVRQPAVSQPRQASACGAELNRVASSGVILFETASARLDDASYETLDKLAGVAKTCDRVSIVVEGHTDDRGSASFNQRLSERRAQAVAAYLQGAGVPGGGLSAVGYGETRPAVPNTSAANLAKNRRIEFSVSGN